MDDLDGLLGMLVFSKAGRDLGRPYLVVGREADGYLLVADGHLRRVSRAKRKNIKHLNLTGLTEKEIRVELLGGTFPCDSSLRKVIKELLTDKNMEVRG